MEVKNWTRILAPYEQAVKELSVKFNALKDEYSKLKMHPPIEQIEYRVKSEGSILEKASKKNIPHELIEEKVDDIAGIRIISRFVEDIGRVLELIRQRDGYDLKILKERDYITSTKPSGYRSYHIVVKYQVMTIDGLRDIKVEIQLRTLAMNFWATIEHSLRYKYSGNIPEDLQRRLISTAEAAYKLDMEMSTIHDEIIEAQKIIQRRNNLVEQILNNINKLYFVAKIEKMNEMNKQFYNLYVKGDIDMLADFNRQLNVIAQMYKVQYE